MTFYNLVFATLLFSGIIIDKTNATDTTIVDLAFGGNVEIDLPQWPDHSTAFTVCSSIYPIMSRNLHYPLLTLEVLNDWVVLYVFSISKPPGFTGFYIIKAGRQILNGQVTGTLFPLQWVTFCVSLDTLTGRVQVIFDTKLALSEICGDFVSTDGSLLPISLQLGLDLYGQNENSRGVSNLNIFSSALSEQRMKELTKAGGAECGAPGDFLQWEKANLTLTGNGTKKRVDSREGPCWRKSHLNVYSGDFNQPKCMKHCQKLGGRSPPVGTALEWADLQEELKAITNRTRSFGNMWLSSTIGEGSDGSVGRLNHWPENIVPTPGVWRDYYTGEPSESFATLPSSSYDSLKHCMFVNTGVWTKMFCIYPDKFSCACQSRKQPLALRLLGLCRASALRGFGSDRMFGLEFTPRQITADPTNLFFVSRRGTLVEFCETKGKWMLSDMTSNITAISGANKLSYGLGKYNWTFSEDHMCTEEEYPLKLTSCVIWEEFTCHDGECINMDGRCDHVFNCEDRYKS